MALDTPYASGVGLSGLKTKLPDGALSTVDGKFDCSDFIKVDVEEQAYLGKLHEAIAHKEQQDYRIATDARDKHQMAEAMFKLQRDFAASQGEVNRLQQALIDIKGRIETVLHIFPWAM